MLVFIKLSKTVPRKTVNDLHITLSPDTKSQPSSTLNTPLIKHKPVYLAPKQPRNITFNRLFLLKHLDYDLNEGNCVNANDNL